jgi:hypothetical protein
VIEVPQYGPLSEMGGAYAERGRASVAAPISAAGGEATGDVGLSFVRPELARKPGEGCG